MRGIIKSSSRINIAFQYRSVFQSNNNNYKSKKKNGPPLKPTAKKPFKTEEELYQKFQDFRRLKVEGGNGGDGLSVFLSAWCKEFGGPNGGDGGKGGDVIFKCDKSIKSLNKIPPVCKAEDGKKGGKDLCSGRYGEDLVIKVPIGTVFRLDGCEEICEDLSASNKEFVACYGGLGGKGNHFFATSTNTAPDECTEGKMGDNKVFILSLKTLAHCGLVGFPNAGKSSILRALTNATPMIADYPFTTLVPHVGIMQCHDFVQIAIADIPGIIDGSHQDQHDSLQFLKHIQRCRFFIYVLDLSEDDVWNQLKILENELFNYEPSLVDLPRLIVCNKIDIKENHEKFKIFFQKCKKDNINDTIIPLSALTYANTEELMNKIRHLYDVDIKLNVENSFVW